MSFNILKKQLKNLPKTPGVYQFKNDDGVVLYVGKSINVFERIKSHLASDGEKAKAMISASTSIETISVSSELEALLLESNLIRKFMPRYNSSAKDDKSPLYIKITTSEEFPKIVTSRKDNSEDIFFGPFPSSSAVKTVLKQIRRIFPYHSSQITKKACFYFHIGLCNPCPAEIVNSDRDSDRFKELKDKYKKNIKNIKDLLSGKSNVLKNEIEREMNRLAKIEDYEGAGVLRDQINQLNYITAPFNSPKEYLENPNFLEDVHQKELESLQSLLKPHFKYLKFPKRIECFDNSHLQGKSATASMVTFIDGDPDKNYYRQFKINTPNSRDDYAMMREVLTRRIKHFDDWGKADLIVIDGGKGQVGAALSVFKEFNVHIPVIGLAKRLEEIIVPKMGISKDVNYTVFRLPIGAPAIKVLQRIRDEAHRFARRYHFKLRLKDLGTRR